VRNVTKGRSKPRPYKRDHTNMRNRHSYRLPQWDYTANGAYFVTICSYQRRLVFGGIRDGIMGLNRFGCIVWNEWELLAIRRGDVVLDEFVVMPNHIHLILFIERTEEERANVDGAGKMVSGSLGEIMCSWKSGVTREVGKLRGQKTHVWQVRFWDRVIRDEHELKLMRQYIRDNPMNWHNDKQNPENRP